MNTFKSFTLAGHQCSGDKLKNRRMVAVMMKYVSFFLEQGYVKDARAGAFTCVPDCLNKSKWVLEQMGGATFMESVYYCCERNPGNQFVKHIKETGILGIQLIKKNAPTDALVYSRDQGSYSSL